MTDKQPGIIDPPATVDDQFTLQTWMQQMTEAVRQGMGQIGASGQAFLRRDDLVATGLLAPVADDGNAPPVQSEVGEQYQASGQGSYDLTPPPTPVNVVATNGFAYILLTFDFPRMDYPLHAEIWRSTTENREDAILTGAAPAGRYADNVGATDTIYYYWVRYVKTQGINQVYGAFHDAQPVAAQAQGTLNGNLIEQATILDAAIATLGVDKLVGNLADFVTANITEGSITNAMIGNEIRSNNYSAGSTGWRINKAGDAEFFDIKARGLIEGSIIRGSVIEGGLLIQSDIQITTPTEADQGPGSIRFLSLATSDEQTASGTTSTPLLNIYSANYTHEGYEDYGDGEKQEPVYNQLNRFPKYSVSPTATMVTAGGPCSITLKAFRADGSSFNLASLNLNVTHIDHYASGTSGGQKTGIYTRFEYFTWGYAKIDSEKDWYRYDDGRQIDYGHSHRDIRAEFTITSLGVFNLAHYGFQGGEINSVFPTVNPCRAKQKYWHDAEIS